MSLQIERLEFRPWGCFEDLALVFAATPGLVELVYGPNAGGKSTISRGECSLLYGIEAQTQDGHTFQYADLRIGARLRLGDTSIDVVRRKGRSATLLDSSGSPIPEETIGLALGGLTEDVYRAVFQITHESLVRGATELLEGRGEVGASLFAAASGIASLHQTLSGFERQADHMFKPRGRSDPLHRALAELQAAQRRLRDSTLRPARHNDLIRALRAAESVCDQLSQEIRELTMRADAIERRRSIAPLLVTHAQLTTEISGLNGIPDLPADAPERRGSAQSRLLGAATGLERASSGVRQLEGDLSEIDVDESIIARAGDILELQAAMPVIRKAADDRGKREAQVAEARFRLEAAAADVGVDPDQVEALRRPAAARRALDSCLRQHSELTERRRTAGARLGEAEPALQNDRSVLDTTPAAPEVGNLRAAHRAATRLGQITDDIVTARGEHERLAAEVDAALARLNPAPDRLDHLCRLPAPTRSVVIAAADDYEARGRTRLTLAAEAERLKRELAEVEAEREELHLIWDVPTSEALDTARSERDGRWTELRVAVEGEVKPAPEAVDEFESAITAADVLSDTRTARAGQIERAARIEAHARRLERDVRELATRERALEHATVVADERWREQWAQSGLPTPSPGLALAWLDERERVLALAGSAARASARMSALQDQHDSHARSLAAALHQMGARTDAEAGLDVLLEIAEGRLNDAEAQRADRSAAEAAVQRSQREVVAAESELAEAQAALDEWERAWPTRRVEGGLPENATPEAAQEIVRAVGDALAQSDAIADLNRRLSGIDRDRELFERGVRELVSDVAPELASLPSDRAVVALASRLDGARSLITRRESLREQLVAARNVVDDAEHELADARDGLSQLVMEAGCQDASELPAIERGAARARQLRGEISSIEGQIEQIGDGRFEDLRKDAAELDREAASLELATIRERIAELAEERDQRKVDVGEHRQRVADAEGSLAAVDAVQEVELARARVVELAREYAKARLSSAVTRRAIDRYREHHAGPLLRRANDLFTRFTLGTFVQVFIDHDERTGPILIGRQRDRRLKKVPQMSDGTREQLFLALRIAAIERYVASSGQLPVIFDDVFLESDAPRSERIFEALGELAQTTQVIVLTHHEHLIELGRRVLGQRLAVQHLPDTAPTLRPGVPADGEALAA
jgi:uncharacterized protein YhaN